MSREHQAKEAIIQISNILDQWNSMNLDANDALELLEPLLETVIRYFDLAPVGAEKKSKNDDLEKAEDLETPGAALEQESEEGDLFSKTESKNEDVKKEKEEKSKSKSKKGKSYAGSNGEIPF